MISTAEIILHPKQSISFKSVLVTDLSNTSPSRVAKLIREGLYDANCDLNGDGYVDAADYNIIYDMWYSKYDAWMSGQLGIHGAFDIRTLVRIKKYASGVIEGYDPDYDLDNDGHITDIDAMICKYWLVHGRDEKETF